METTEKHIEEILKEVIDPELELNIVDLGLIYDIHCLEGNNIVIIMTLTTPGCPMAEILPASVEEKIKIYYPNSKILVELVWEPAWTPEKITEFGKNFLGL